LNSGLNQAASHASIDPAVRAARGLPEDLIRLCVGIEHVEDLLEDLERALLEAGAITLVQTGDGEPVYARVGHVHERTLEKLNDGLSRLGLEGHHANGVSLREYLVSAPGKVILFGEHAVVHGVVGQVVRV
jgi:hypothetical protein